MPTIRQLRGQQLNRDSAQAKYLFGGFDDVAAVHTYIQEFKSPVSGSLEQEVPYSWGSLYIQMPPDVTELGNGWYAVDVTYGPRNPEAVSPLGGAGNTDTAPPHGDSATSTPVGPELTWSVVGGTQTIFQGIKAKQLAYLRGAVIAEADIPNYERLIGWDQKTGEIKGTERLTSSPRTSYDLEIPGSAVNPAWVRMVEEMCAPNPTINTHKFFGYEPGEVLFLGMSNLRSQNFGSSWKARFDFAISRNRSEIIIYDDGIGSPLKLTKVGGWSHIEVKFKDRVVTFSDGTSGRMSVPSSAKEIQIYESKDFRLMSLQKRRKLVPA
jgi:hypothetical protein